MKKSKKSCQVQVFAFRSVKVHRKKLFQFMLLVLQRFSLFYGRLLLLGPRRKKEKDPQYCVRCDGFTEDGLCQTHKEELIYIPDKEVPRNTENRARLTCPGEVSVCRSGIKYAGLGVYSNTLIQAGTIFGPYEGIVRHDVDVSSDSIDGDYAWMIGGHFVDARDQKWSNWMRLLFSSFCEWFKSQD